ncbi:MAG: recombination protein RecR [Deltaproteobacteria bacterium]|jgi:recombination protein RecR|nr:recombination protein RecR [Deltaproteobacteria bacterium]
MLRISSLERLVHQLNRLPGIGPKTAQRLAYQILREPELSTGLQEALVAVRETVHLCDTCFSYTDEPSVCRFCADPNRREDLLCVVEEPSDIVRVESSGAFRGRYHVLHGAISPLDGVGPDDLKIRELLLRIDQAKLTAPMTEVILALDPDLEGDTTVLYLAKILSERGLKVTRIASGVPLGSDIDYVDDRTLGRALENRVEL